VSACAATVGRHVQFQETRTAHAHGALGIGCSQIFALFAGISRSGISMVAGLDGRTRSRGVGELRVLAGDAGHILAGILKLPDSDGTARRRCSLPDAGRFAVRYGDALISVKFLTKWFTTKTLIPFGFYSLVAGLLCGHRFA